jgi:hypothetical protein
MGEPNMNGVRSFAGKAGVVLLAGWLVAPAAAQPAPVESLYVETRQSPQPPPAVRFPTAADSAEKPSPQDRKREGKELDIPLNPPTPEQLFRLQSEAQLLEEIRAEGRQRGIKVVFPTGATADSGPVRFPPRPNPPAWTGPLAVPVCYHPLYFEDRCSERYGWCVHGLQPVISAGAFYLDVLALPYNVVRHPPCSLECNTGLPLPGDPVPCTHSIGPAGP